MILVFNEMDDIFSPFHFRHKQVSLFIIQRAETEPIAERIKKARPEFTKKPQKN